MENKIFFSSDFHYYHRNLCLGTSNWPHKEESCRKFETIEEMNNSILESINSVVGEEDWLYHLGDWSFGGYINIWNFRKQIRCKHIIEIIGNHDDRIKENKFFPWLERKDGVIKEIINESDYRKKNEIKLPEDVTATDLFDEIIDGRLTMTIKGQQIIMDHYPYEDWENSDSGSWMLHGHVHHGLDDSEISNKYKRMDVGWNGKVYSFDEIKEIMDQRENKLRH
jgi:calcineurin-like phosphoesterase family protein